MLSYLIADIVPQVQAVYQEGRREVKSMHSGGKQSF
jgi:hypothetical protein